MFLKPGDLVQIWDNTLGIYLYPHEREINAHTICSVILRSNKEIYHIRYGDMKSYEGSCWNCGHLLNNTEDAVCGKCHWVICSTCGLCRQNKCIDDGIHILYTWEYDNWEKLTGFDKDTFFSIALGYQFFKLHDGNVNEVESYYCELLKYDFQPILVIEEDYKVSLYIDRTNKKRAYTI